MILYTINGSGSDAVAAAAKYLNIKIEQKARSDFRDELAQHNPSITVPTLLCNDVVITETVAILRMLANKYDTTLLGKSERSRVLVDELLSIISTGLYAGYIQRFRPEKFVSDERNYQDVQTMAVTNLSSSLMHLENRMPEEGPFLAGKYLTIADFYAAVILRWQQSISELTDTTPKLLSYWTFIQTQESLKRD